MCLAIPGKVVELQQGADVTNRPGKVSFGGIVRQVNFCFLTDVQVDDYVLVHVGVALSKVDEKEALQTLDYLRKMGELDELNPEPDGTGLEKDGRGLETDRTGLEKDGMGSEPDVTGLDPDVTGFEPDVLNPEPDVMKPGPAAAPPLTDGSRG